MNQKFNIKNNVINKVTKIPYLLKIIVIKTVNINALIRAVRNLNRLTIVLGLKLNILFIEVNNKV